MEEYGLFDLSSEIGLRHPTMLTWLIWIALKIEVSSDISAEIADVIIGVADYVYIVKD